MSCSICYVCFSVLFGLTSSSIGTFCPFFFRSMSICEMSRFVVYCISAEHQSLSSMSSNSIGKEEAKMRSECVLTIASTIATNEMLVNLINTLAHYGSHFFSLVEFVREHFTRHHFTLFSSFCLLHLCLYQINTIRAMSEQQSVDIYLSEFQIFNTRKWNIKMLILFF